MRRLYLQIYLTVVGILLLFGALVFAAWLLLPMSPQDRRALEGLGVVLSEMLPGPEQPPAALQAALTGLAQRLSVHLAVYGAERKLLAEAGERLPPPEPGRTQSGWLRPRGAGPTMALRLPDGRWVVVRYVREDRVANLLRALALLAVAVALGAYPVVRRLTRRLERLQARVDALGAGDLTARVKVEGRDEVANLARSFNRAADRIERLVVAQREVLAGASHELRSPLARIRMGIELLGREPRPDLRERLAHDVAELDELIGELLLASRLDATNALECRETVDLLALLAEEGARTGAEVCGERVRIEGDSRLLRRLLRNLLENARRYGADSPVEARVGVRAGAGALLRVADRGPGVPEAERERIFQPFYRPPGTRQSGTGLGLALVRRIARHYGGEVRCFDRPGGGTCFEVTLGSEKPIAYSD